MDWHNLQRVKELVDELTGSHEPSDEELDFNEDYINVYHELHNLKETLENIGL